MAMTWWRSHHGAPMDAKYLAIADLARVSPALVTAMVWALLDHASRQPVRGSVGGFDLDGFAAFQRAPLADCRRLFSAMSEIGRPLHDGVTLVAWAGRQTRQKTDSTAAARAKKYRAGKSQKRAESPNVTPRHDVTERDASRLESVTGRDVTPVTPRHADREEQEHKRELFSAVDFDSAVTPQTIESVTVRSTEQAAAERGHTSGLEGEQERPAKGWFSRLVGVGR